MKSWSIEQWILRCLAVMQSFPLQSKSSWTSKTCKLKSSTTLSLMRNARIVNAQISSPFSCFLYHYISGLMWKKLCCFSLNQIPYNVVILLKSIWILVCSQGQSALQDLNHFCQKACVLTVMTAVLLMPWDNGGHFYSIRIWSIMKSKVEAASIKNAEMRDEYNRQIIYHFRLNPFTVLPFTL